MKNVAFVICGTGNGHVTQALTIYKMLKSNNFQVPVIISVGRESKYEWEEIFKDADYYHIFMPVSEEEMNTLNFISQVNFLRAFYEKVNLDQYKTKYGIDMFISFWTPNFSTSVSVPFISIASQFTLENKALSFLINLYKKKQIPVSIGTPNKYSPYWIPYLIDDKKLVRENNGKKICLAYAVSGIDFQKNLCSIAMGNKDYEIHFFFKTKPVKNFPRNVIYHKTSRVEFKKYQEIANCVLCTSGNELIQECIYNGIPVASMACNKSHFEQVANQQKYCDRLKATVLMSPTLNLDELSNRDVSIYQKQMESSIENREDKIISLINHFLK